MTKTERPFRVDPEFRELLPQLTDAELDQLIASLSEDGCRDPIVVWKEGRILLDGHNRHSLCERLDIEVQVVEMSFPDRVAAKAWMIRNQLARRNLSTKRFHYFIGELYNREKKQGSRPKKARHGDVVSEGATADRIAAEHGVSPRTVQRSGDFAANLDAIAENVGDGLFGKMLDERSELSRRDVKDLAEQQPQTMQEVDEFAEQRAAEKLKRRESSPADGPGYFQKEIKETNTYTGADGVEYVRSVVLSCGHVKPYKRKSRADKKRKSAPCYECGSGTRAPSDRRRAERVFQQVMDDALASDEGRATVCQVVKLALQIATFRLGDARAMRVREELGRVCGVLGLEAKHLKA